MKAIQMPLRNKHSLIRQAGFSLVEILVGLVIGLLATLVIMQVFSVFEGQKRSTTGKADAQTNGGIALYSVVRDMQMAGYGLLPTIDSAIECDAPTIGAAAAAVIPALSPLSPVIITDGGTGSDSIAIRYSTSATAGNPVPITNVTAPPDVTVNNGLACQTGTALIITSPTTCNITTVTALVNNIDAPSGSAVSATATLSDATGAALGATLACLGEWREVKYAANAGNLERDATPMLAGVVNIQAQYGIADTASNNNVTTWIDATGAWAADTISTADRNRIKALRVAIVARDGLLEKDIVTKLQLNGKACGGFNTDAPLGLCAWAGTVTSPAPEIDLTSDNNWQHYRYRVFETIIPLRNVIWSKETL